MTDIKDIKSDIRIKICGIRRPQEIEWLNELKPEYVGFVFAKSSKRYISPDDAAGLKKELDPSIKTVGVFVNEDPGEVAALLNRHVIDIAQLHGQEDRGYVALLRMLTDHPIIRAIKVETYKGIIHANESPASYVLLDHGSGGTGESFDWSLLDEMKRPFFLAGGLNCDNVEKAIASAGPWLYGVDVSSGLETDGVKDYEKMKRFVQTVRSLRIN